MTASGPSARKDAGGTPLGTPRLQSSLRLGAEALVSGSAARAAYKKAQVTGENARDQTWPELMRPAGLCASELRRPPNLQHTQVTELLAEQHALGAKHLSTAPLHGGRFVQAAPKPGPLPPVVRSQKLKVTMRSARGLKNMDSNRGGGGGQKGIQHHSAMATRGLSDAFCTCEIVGKPHTKVKTEVVYDTLSPVWDTEVVVDDFVEGDALQFTVWDSDQAAEDDDLLGMVTIECAQFHPMGLEREVPLAEAGDGQAAFLNIAIAPAHDVEAELNVYGGVYPADDLTAKHVRRYMLCARRLGARGLPRLAKALMAASVDGVLDEQAFLKVSMAEGLSTVNDACARVFCHYKSVAGGIVPVELLMACARGKISPPRLRSVQEIWRTQVDPQGRGFIKVNELVSRFCPELLPSVKIDGLSADMARREFLEGLGGCETTVQCKNEVFALEEAASGRRPLPAGSAPRDVPVPRHISIHAAGGPVGAPAGKPGKTGEARRQHDYLEEVQARPSRVPPGARVTAQQFEDHYTALSHGIPDDRQFEKILRDPWRAHQVHAQGQARRWDMSAGGAKKNPVPPQFRIAATFSDGSKRVVLLTDIDGLSESIGQAGVHCSQMWTWGPDIRDEVIRRLEKEGIRGVVHVKPIAC